MNIVTLTGRLTADPRLSYTPNTDTAVASFRLAVQRMSKRDEADFINCKTFGKQAETLSTYMHKGGMVGVVGRIETGSYKNKEGKMVYTTEVICDRVEFLSTRGNSETSRDNTSYVDMPDSFAEADEDIPF